MPILDPITKKPLTPQEIAMRVSGKAPAPSSTPANIPGSVFDNPTSEQKVQRALSRVMGESGVTPEAHQAARRLAPAVASMVPPVAASFIAGPEAGLAARLGMQAVGGALSPYAAAGAAKATGQPAEMPSWKDAAKSAAWNMAFSAVGEPIARHAPVGAPRVAAELSEGAPNIKTVSQIQQALRNRDLLKRSGMTDAEIDAMHATPDGMTAAEDMAQSALKTKNLFQQAVATKRRQLTQRFDQAFGKWRNFEVSSEPLANTLDSAIANLSEHEPSSTMLNFLKRKLDQFGGAGAKNSDIVSKTIELPGGDLYEKSGAQSYTDRLRATRLERAKLLGLTGKQTQAVAGVKNRLTLDDLRQLITETREELPRNASELDKSLANQVTKSAEDMFDQGMREAGAPDANISAVRRIRTDYGNFMSTVRELDPRSERFGAQAANALFGTAEKKPEEALYFARMVSEADRVNPGAMNQFRKGLLQHVMDTARAGAKGGGPIEQMRIAATIRNQIGGSKAGTAFLREVFGSGPMSDATQFSRVVGRIGDPAITQSAKTGLSKMVGGLGWAGRYAALYTGVQLLTGQPLHGGIWGAITSPAGLTTMAAMLGSAKLADAALGAGGPISRTYADWLLQPDNAANFQKFVRAVSAGAGALEATGLPREAPNAASGPRFTKEGPEFYGAAYKANAPFARPGPYVTNLPAAQEQQFRAWVKDNKVPFDPNEKTSDYDMRGYWRDMKAGKIAPWKGGSTHFPDTYKTPYDTSFSGESEYASPDNPLVWEGDSLINKKTGEVVFHAASGR